MITLHRFARITAGTAFLLLIVGGLVTSTGSSLAVPDWPLSYGQFFPPMTGGVLFEHGHRMIAGVVAIMTWILAIWVWRAETRRWVRATAAAAALGIVLQAILGGLTVLFKLPHPISIAHACLGQTVFCLLLVLAQATSPWYVSEETTGAAAGNFWILGAGCVAAVYVQLVLGAIVRHAGAVIPLHLLWAAVVAGLIAFVGYRVFSDWAREKTLLRPAGLILGLIPLQALLGLAALVVRARPASRVDLWRVVFPTFHVAVGAAILGICVVWTLRAYRLRGEGVAVRD